MATSIELIKSQQAALQAMGLYKGKIDGAWNLQSRLAMAGLQHNQAFCGLKARSDNNYFSPFEKLPTGWAWASDGTVAFADSTFNSATADDKATEAGKAEQERMANEAKANADKAEQEKVAKEAAAAEEKRLADEKIAAEQAEEKRLADEKLAAEVEEKRLADEKIAQDAQAAELLKQQEAAVEPPAQAPEAPAAPAEEKKAE